MLRGGPAPQQKSGQNAVNQGLGPVPRRKASLFELAPPPPGALLLESTGGGVAESSSQPADTISPHTLGPSSSPQGRTRRLRSSQGSDAMAMLWNGLDERRLSHVAGTEYSPAAQQTKKENSLLRQFIGPLQGEHFPYTNKYVIHPNSACAAMIFLTSGILLIYSAIQLPLDIGFSWDQDLCDADRALLQFNIFVDTFFCVEIIATFFVGVLHGESGSYIDDLPTVAWLYVKSRFLFDCVTSLPTSWVEYAALSGCGGKENAEGDAVLESMRLFRLLKPLRLVKLLRFFKFAKIFTILDGFLRISPNTIRLAKLLFGLILLVNLVACIYWLLKSSFDANFDEFLENHGVNPDSMTDKWILAVYFINTVFTTVGFGDISGDNEIERAFCIVIMWVGTGIFATLVNGLQEVGMDLNEKNREKNQYVQRVVRWLRQKNCPAWVEHEVSAWLRFKFDHDKLSTERTEVLEVLPPQLQLSMVMHLNGQLINQSWVFGQLEHAEAGRMLQELSLAMRFEIYNADELIASHDTPCDRLYMIWNGQVSVQVFEDGETKEVAVLRKGEYFGEFSLLGDTSWGPNFGAEVEFWAPEHTELAVIFVRDFARVMTHFSKDLYEELKDLAYTPLGGDLVRLQMETKFRENRKTRKETGRSVKRSYIRWEVLVAVILRRLRQETSKRMQNVLANFATAGAARTASSGRRNSLRTDDWSDASSSTDGDVYGLMDPHAGEAPVDDVTLLASRGGSPAQASSPRAQGPGQEAASEGPLQNNGDLVLAVDGLAPSCNGNGHVDRDISRPGHVLPGTDVSLSSAIGRVDSDMDLIPRPAPSASDSDGVGLTSVNQTNGSVADRRGVTTPSVSVDHDHDAMINGNLKPSLRSGLAGDEQSNPRNGEHHDRMMDGVGGGSLMAGLGDWTC